MTLQRTLLHATYLAGYVWYTRLTIKTNTRRVFFSFTLPKIDNEIIN